MIFAALTLLTILLISAGDTAITGFWHAEINLF
jgi:hypothetical protein